ncbi:hydroxyisourate hydrolase [soil metagenome]
MSTPGTVPTATLSTHVLDSVLGRPAPGMTVVLTDPGGFDVAEGVTDPDGRIRFAEPVAAGSHRLTFATGPWFAAAGRETFYPVAIVAFTVAAGEHHHVALLLGPWSYTTYRGS